MQLSHKIIRERWKEIHGKNKKYLHITLVLLLACFLLSLCFRTEFPEFIPKHTLLNLWEALKLTLAHAVGSPYYLKQNEIIHSFAYYAESLIRLKISLFTVLSGMALGLAGAVFQQVYHNPIASPSTIGATVGVNFGNMFMVTLFSSSAMVMILYRYVACFVFTGLIMLAVLLVGRYLGKKGNTYSVVEMLMFGSILSRMITAYNTYKMYHLSGVAFITYQQLNLGISQVYTNKSLLIFLVVMVAGMTPLLKMRFRMNVLGFDAMEAQAAGVRLWTEQIFSQMLGAAIIAAACIQCGDIGLFALVIPHLVRYLVGSDFRKLAVFSTVYGGIFLLAIRMVTSMIYLGDSPIPMNFIVSIVMIPVFMAMLALRRRGFD